MCLLKRTYAFQETVGDLNFTLTWLLALLKIYRLKHNLRPKVD